jgi:toxin FitB
LPVAETAISAVTLAELEFGAQSAPTPTRREELAQWIEKQIIPRFQHRTLAVDGEVLTEWLDLMKRIAAARRSGLATDLLIAATARVHKLIIVTRNSRDYAGTGATILDPWSGRTHVLERL